MSLVTPLQGMVSQHDGQRAATLQAFYLLYYILKANVILVVLVHGMKAGWATCYFIGLSLNIEIEKESLAV